MNSTQRLARFASELKYRQIPREVIERAKACVLDILAVSLYGSTKPWSKMVSGFALASAAKGRATICGSRRTVPAERAALANGTLAHAFELDNVRQPGAGVHPGATGFLPAFAAAEETKADGKALLCAFIAGCEVMSRIGVAAGNSVEHRGFHAPGLTGPFGAAVAAGKLFGLDEKQLTNAMGIAGSYSGGLIEFSRCQEGAMVKRLHLGKAAEGGVTAARLAGRGFAGPESVLEGEFGFCRSFADTPKLDYLTHRFGAVWESMNICIKRCACHINAHAPIEALQALRAELKFDAEEIRAIEIGGIEKLLTHHANYRPGDLMMAQYSIPFCVALSLYFDPSDPASFDEGKLADRNILKMMAKVRLKVDHEIEAKGWDRAARVSVDLGKRGRHNKLVIHFKGTPGNPMTGAEVQAKAQKLTGSILSPRQFARLVETVAQLEKLSDSAKLGAILRTAQ